MRQCDAPRRAAWWAIGCLSIGCASRDRQLVCWRVLVWYGRLADPGVIPSVPRVRCWPTHRTVQTGRVLRVSGGQRAETSKRVARTGSTAWCPSPSYTVTDHLAADRADEGRRPKDGRRAQQRRAAAAGTGGVLTAKAPCCVPATPSEQGSACRGAVGGLHCRRKASARGRRTERNLPRCTLGHVTVETRHAHGRRRLASCPADL